MMSDPSQLRRTSRQIFDAALLAVDARAATRRALTLNGSLLRIVDADFDLSAAKIYVVSVGKAAVSMALGIDDAIGAKISGGVISGPAQINQAQLPIKRWQHFVGGHPLPNEASLASAQAVFDLLDRANLERAVVVFLISGGGSAMVESPANQMIALADLREANRLLVGCGASISEMNAVRRAFSAVKGGALARRANQASIVTLIVSDTNPGDEIVRKTTARANGTHTMPVGISYCLITRPQSRAPRRKQSQAGLRSKLHQTFASNRSQKAASCCCPGSQVSAKTREQTSSGGAFSQVASFPVP